MTVNQYYPEPTPHVQDNIIHYVETELNRVSSVVNLIGAGFVEFLNAEPTKLYEGLVRGADGSDWDPGSGKGVYVYYDSAWHKLG